MNWFDRYMPKAADFIVGPAVKEHYTGLALWLPAPARHHDVMQACYLYQDARVAET